MDTACIEVTDLERKYRIFPTLFINFLKADQRAHQKIILVSIAKDHYQDWAKQLELDSFMADNYEKAIEFANEQFLLLVHQREKLVEHLALTKTYFKHNPNNVVMKFRCD